MGNSLTNNLHSIQWSVHPHVCGELTQYLFIDRDCNGSSPRVWGTLICYWKTTAACRFIPTCVGNSVLYPAISSMITVHPHVCGELSMNTYASSSVAGSSPRVWGTQPGVSVGGNVWRFIPTCVGNSFGYTLYIPKGTVHPHVCGELE